MPDRDLLLQRLREAIAAPGADRRALLEDIESSEPADVARCIEEFEPAEAAPLFQAFDPETAGAILVELSDEYQQEVVAALPVRRLQRIVDTLPPDDAADVYNLLPHAHRIGILQSIDKDLAEQIRKLAAYEEETAGAIMTPQFVAVREDEKATDVLDQVRSAEKFETDQVYVVDENERLKGVLSIQDLLQAEDAAQAIRDVMEDQVIAVHEDADQEEVVRVSSTYGLTTVPVVDDAQRLVGIVTADDLDFVQEEEASEDIFRMAGTVARHPTKLPVYRRILNRLPTMFATVLIGLVTAQILGRLSHGATANVASESLLVAAMRYVLIVIALAGNVGNISNAIVVRGLATAELERGRLMQPFLGELMVGLGIGAICAILTFLGIGLIEGDRWGPLGSVVALALLTSVTFSAAMGFLIPLFCEQIGIDPALAGPLVTALNDLAGTAVYVTICILMLG